jgi:hypothetical protein
MTLLNRKTLAGLLDAAAGCLPVRYITCSKYSIFWSCMACPVLGRLACNPHNTT